MDAVTVIAIVGGISLIVGLLGGGIEAERLKIPLIPPRARVFAGIVGVILIAISVWLSTPARFQGPLPNNPPTLQATPIPNETNTSSQTSPASSDLLACETWRDDFSLPSRWPQNQWDWVESAYQEQEYKILLYHPNYLSYVCWHCDVSLDSFAASVSGRTVNGAGSWGIYFWAKGSLVYAFEIDGQTAYLKQYNDGLSNVTILEHKDIEQLSTNRISIQYLNGTLTGSVNSKEAIRLPFTPAPVGSGTYGIGLSTASNTENFEVRYDDYELLGCP